MRHQVGSGDETELKRSNGALEPNGGELIRDRGRELASRLQVAGQPNAWQHRLGDGSDLLFRGPADVKNIRFVARCFDGVTPR